MSGAPESILSGRHANHTAAVTAGVPNTRLEFAYDSQSRRTIKRVLRANEEGILISQNTLIVLYDGWSLIAEFKMNPRPPQPPPTMVTVTSRRNSTSLSAGKERQREDRALEECVLRRYSGSLQKPFGT